jgi:trans-aconitate 2-methyltransferase
MWDPSTYLRYADERSRPFHDLLNRVAAEFPSLVVDLGCGTGHLTGTLAERWPGADVVGVDNSAEMIAKAEPLSRPRLRFELADLRHWKPDRPIDVIISNAALHWAPEQLDVLRSLTQLLTPGGWLAFQVPGNFGSQSHVVLYELMDSQRWRTYLGGVPRPAVPDAATYLDVLAECGLAVDAWETTYLHVLQGEDAVLQWMSGTALRPVLAGLPGRQRDEFLHEYAARLRDVYEPRPYGTVLPYRRIFVVAHS